MNELYILLKYTHIRYPEHGIKCNISLISEKTNDIVVTWSTFNDTTSVVRYKNYGESEWQLVMGSSKVFIDGGQMKRPQWIHRVTLKDLAYDTRYSEFVNLFAL